MSQLMVKRDSSPLRTTHGASDSQSDSSEEVSPPKSAATAHPPRPSDNQVTERECSPIRPCKPRGPLDRRPVSTRTKELMDTDNSLSKEDIASEIEQIERVQRQLTAKRKKRQENADLLLQHKQLVLDHAFVLHIFELKKCKEDVQDINEILFHDKEALDGFVVDHPDIAGSPVKVASAFLSSSQS